MKKVIIGIIGIYACISLTAQQVVCGSIIKSNEENKRRARLDSTIAYHLYRGDYKLDSTGITIPIVVHIVWQNDNENLTDALIMSQIDALNRDYNALNSDIQYVPDEFKPVIGNVGIHFCLAAKDPQGNPTTGIVRQQTSQPDMGLSSDLFYTSLGGSDAWDVNRYMNIWVANTGQYIAGYGIYPWSDSAGRSGLVVNSPFFGINGGPQYGLGRVCVHEVGHYLGLIHLWGDVYDCSVSDRVSDTPPQSGPYYGCPSYPEYGCGGSTMFMNFMDYVDDQCMLLFTEGQKARMVVCLNTYRAGLINSNAQCLVPSQSNDLNAKIYPNPGTGIFTVAFATPPMNLLTYSVYNEMGELILTNAELANKDISFDMTGYSAGVYMFIVKENGITVFKTKVLKEQ